MEESLEQRIGTRWILIAGVIMVLFGVGFFLKFAYDQNWLQPWFRAGIIAVGGLLALGIGEITRRRDYDIVAKGTTALGLALLYAADFAAYRVYDLLNPVPAYALAVCITVGAMIYAMRLEEVIIAFLSLFGGYLTPILLITDQNLPASLFTYALILSLSAMACAYLRWWRVVNVVTFAGTYLLYTVWFEKFYPSQQIAEGLSAQMPVALGWLAVFFGIYLFSPLLYGLVRRTLSRKEDVWLEALNALVILYYLFRILYPSGRTEMAIGCFILCGIYLAVRYLISLRCPQDRPLRMILLIIALSFLTVALPLYFKMRFLVMAWAVEGVTLTAIGLQYQSRSTRTAGILAAVLGMLCLFYYHNITEYGQPLILNPAFGVWFFVCAAIMIQHVLYRFLNAQDEEESDPPQTQHTVGNILYVLSMMLLFVGCCFEWFAFCRWHLDLNTPTGPVFFQGMILLMVLSILSMIVRPVCPKSLLCSLCAILFSTTGTVYTAFITPWLYHRNFLLFANTGFLFSTLFTGTLFLCAWLLSRRKDKTMETDILAYAYAMGGIILLWILLSNQIYFYWKFKNQYIGPIDHWSLKAHMYMSVLWACYGAVLMVIGFWKNLSALRYLALALFALLVGKIFLYDLSTLKTQYRIAAFLVTGLILVAVSYLYQFGKKRGFFDASRKNVEKQEEPL